LIVIAILSPPARSGTAVPIRRVAGEEVDHLRVVVTQLRKKIEGQPSRPTHLLTEPWVGYRLHLPSAA
jgi:DNA-binding response OmpR family regulator